MGIHGLWINGGDCGEAPFDKSALSSLESQLEQDWPSCAEFGKDNEGLWSHEWSKHGVCSGMDEQTFFQTTLDLYSKYVSQCSSTADSTPCELTCNGAPGSITCQPKSLLV